MLLTSYILPGKLVSNSGKVKQEKPNLLSLYIFYYFKTPVRETKNSVSYLRAT